MCRKWHKIRDPCDYKKACNILQTPNTKLEGKLEVSSKEECLQSEVEEKDKNESQIERILKREWDNFDSVWMWLAKDFSKDVCKEILCLNSSIFDESTNLIDISRQG